MNQKSEPAQTLKPVTLSPIQMFFETNNKRMKSVLSEQCHKLLLVCFMLNVWFSCSVFSIQSEFCTLSYSVFYSGIIVYLMFDSMHSFIFIGNEM